MMIERTRERVLYGRARASLSISLRVWGGSVKRKSCASLSRHATGVAVEQRPLGREGGGAAADATHKQFAPARRPYLAPAGVALLLGVELDHVVDAEDGDGGLGGEAEALDLGDGGLEDAGVEVVADFARGEVETRELEGLGVVVSLLRGRVTRAELRHELDRVLRGVDLPPTHSYRFAFRRRLVPTERFQTDLDFVDR